MSDDEKLFYTIGEVADLLGVKSYVLRYWETEFSLLNPQKSVTGQRTYRKKDIQVALTIKRLLYDEQYTIAGAIKKLEEIERVGFDQIEVILANRPSTKSSAESLSEPDSLKENSFSPLNRVSLETAREVKNLIQSTFKILEKYNLV
jgi:DNA-binding transcriptional MerR regulator